MQFDEFAAKYCDRQEMTPEGLRATLMSQKKRFRCDGWVLLECQVLDSSYLGQLVIVPYGPDNTYKSPPDRPVSPRGLASDTSVVVGTLLAADLPGKQPRRGA